MLDEAHERTIATDVLAVWPTPESVSPYYVESHMHDLLVELTVRAPGLRASNKRLRQLPRIPFRSDRCCLAQHSFPHHISLQMAQPVLVPVDVAVSELSAIHHDIADIAYDLHSSVQE